MGSGFVFVQEFAAFIRAFKLFVCERDCVPAFFEIQKLLTPGQTGLCVIDAVRHQSLIGKDFPFDVSSQRNYLFKEVQTF